MLTYYKTLILSNLFVNCQKKIELEYRVRWQVFKIFI